MIAINNHPKKRSNESQPSVKPKILLLDDDMIAQHAVRAIAEECNCYIDTCDTCQKALDLISDQYLFAIFDVDLPDSNGIETCRQVRQRLLTLPIIILTARQDSLEDEALKAGANIYLQKPLSVSKFLKILNCYLPKPIKR